jgi:hypothetical protein
LFPSSSNESFKAAFHALGKGVKVERTTEPITVQGKNYPAGSFLMPLAKEYTALDTLLMVSPLFLQQKPSVAVAPVKVPRVGIVETWVHDMDAGWLRYIFDQYGVPFKVLRPAELQTARLQRDFDILFFPDRAKSIYMTGKFEREGKTIPLEYQPEFTKGMESKGFENLMQFINNGGKVMAWGPSVLLFEGSLSQGEGAAKEDFILPFSDISKELTSAGLYVPGSLLKLRLQGDHSMLWGLPREFGVFHRGTPVFRTTIPSLDMDRRILASFADTGILISGYAQKEELLRKEAALLWLKKGKGQIILSSFNPQFRASTAVAYKLIFNALLLE